MKLASLSLTTPYTKHTSAYNLSSKLAYAFLADAAGDSWVYADEHNSGVGAESRVHIRVNAEISLSLINFAHYSEESFEEQAKLFEVGITVNGSLLGADEGNEDAYFHQLKISWLKKFFEALEDTEYVTAEGINGLLAALSENH